MVTIYNSGYKRPLSPAHPTATPREIMPVMPRTKPERETQARSQQAGSQPMRRGLGRQDYSSIKTAGARTGIPPFKLCVFRFCEYIELTNITVICHWNIRARQLWLGQIFTFFGKKSVREEQTIGQLGLGLL